MIVETSNQLEKIFLEVRLSFSEIRPQLEIFERGKHRSWSMGADVYYTGNIFWRKSILGMYSVATIRGMLAHEFGHLVNQDYMRAFNQQQIALDKKRYRYCRVYRESIEREADKTAVQRGFGKEIYELVKTFMQEKEWREKAAGEHLSLDEIKKLMKKN